MNTEDLHSMQLEIIDRFGLLPLETKMLFNLSRFRLIATLLGITHIRLGHKGGNFEFRPDAPIDSQGLSHLLNKKPQIFQMISPVKLKISGNLSDTDTRDPCNVTRFSKYSTEYRVSCCCLPSNEPRKRTSSK
jgi:transcription-repair coupling factor (superfamily II helicase)